MTLIRRSPMPPRSKPMDPGQGLTRSRWLPPGDASSAPLRARKPISPVSAKRARENRARAKMADRRWPDRREGTVLCAVWEAIQPDWCDRWAADLHETLPRGRGGSIADEEITIPTCRPCNHKITESPSWAYSGGFLKHDGECCRGRDVCAQYEDGAA